jgi:hypothetical protein
MLTYGPHSLDTIGGIDLGRFLLIDLWVGPEIIKRVFDAICFDYLNTEVHHLNVCNLSEVVKEIALPYGLFDSVRFGTSGNQPGSLLFVPLRFIHRVAVDVIPRWLWHSSEVVICARFGLHCLKISFIHSAVVFDTGKGIQYSLSTKTLFGWPKNKKSAMLVCAAPVYRI